MRARNKPDNAPLLATAAPATEVMESQKSASATSETKEKNSDSIFCGWSTFKYSAPQTKPKSAPVYNNNEMGWTTKDICGNETWHHEDDGVWAAGHNKGGYGRKSKSSCC